MKSGNDLKTLKKVGAALLLATTALAASAQAGVPVDDPQCGSWARRLNAPARAAGVVFDAECRTAFVKPPAFGKAELVAMTRSSNLTFCPAVNNAGATSANTVESAKIISQQIRDMIQSYEPLSQEVITLRQQTSDARAEKDVKEALANEAKKKATSAEDALAAANDALRACRRTADNPETECTAETQARDEAKTAYRDAYDAFATKNEAYQAALREFKTKEGRLIEEQTRYVEAIKPLTDLQSQLVQLASGVMGLYREYARLEGTTGQMLYKTEWQALVNEFKRLNPSAPVQFQQIGISDGNITFASRVSSGADDITIPALLSAAIPGVRPMGAANFPAGGKIEASGSGTAESQGEIGQKFLGFQDAVSGQIVLSLNGACPYFDSPTGAPTNVDAQNLAAHLVVNMQYTYDIQSKRSYVSHYNLSNMTEIIERHVEEGGLFDTSVLDEKLVNNSGSEWFSIEFANTSGGHGYTDEQKRQITAEEKIDLISRGLRQMASFAQAASNRPPAVGQAPQSGVGSAAGTSHVYCGPVLACHIGIVVLGVLDSIFGDHEAVAHFKMNNSVWITNSVVDKKMIRHYGGLTFRPDAGF